MLQGRMVGCTVVHQDSCLPLRKPMLVCQAGDGGRVLQGVHGLDHLACRRQLAT